MNLNLLLENFWIWCGLSAEEYAASAGPLIPEFDYPNFEAMIQCVEKEILKENKEIKTIDLILTVLALDNEAENILDFMVENLSEEYLQVIVTYGWNHMQPHTRWQIAELLFRRQLPNYKEVLYLMLKDENEYVRKRVANLVRDMTQDTASRGDTGCDSMCDPNTPRQGA